MGPTIAIPGTAMGAGSGWPWTGSRSGPLARADGRPHARVGQLFLNRGDGRAQVARIPLHDLGERERLAPPGQVDTAVHVTAGADRHRYGIAPVVGLPPGLGVVPAEVGRPDAETPAAGCRQDAPHRGRVARKLMPGDIALPEAAQHRLPLRV